VVADNGGGIFDHLPLAALGTWLTWLGGAVRVSLAGLAAAHGLDHRHAATGEDFAAVVGQAFATGGPWIVEVPIDRRISLACWSAYWAAAAI
jgi:2-succinyl-5-enolpyruvyl-6-hydroxy-3-cyclohexene-1-carboxylate synthase